MSINRIIFSEFDNPVISKNKFYDIVKKNILTEAMGGDH